MSSIVRNRAGYIPLGDDDEITTQYDRRFDLPAQEIPYGSIALAAVLTCFGGACLVLAWLHFTQQLFGKEQAELGFTIVGLLTFVPGAYHTWIALCCWRGLPGYRWSDIPN